MNTTQIIKAALFGILEGITEWLPISSTGHLILAEQFLRLDMPDAFLDLFLVAIQLGAILAVVVLYWKKLVPFTASGGSGINRQALLLWGNVLVASAPAAIVGLLFEDEINRIFFNYQTVAVALLVYGVLLVFLERLRKGANQQIDELPRMPWKTALWIGLFQILALIPGTSRSGATIVGAMLVGTSRAVAAEFTFFLAIPVMFGASFLKLMKFGLSFQGGELAVLATGMVTAFAVSILAIRFLTGYVKSHSFAAFGWYRIILGGLILAYFLRA